MNSNHPGSGRLLSNLSECARQQAFWGCWCNGDVTPTDQGQQGEEKLSINICPLNRSASLVTRCPSLRRTPSTERTLKLRIWPKSLKTLYSTATVSACFCAMRSSNSCDLSTVPRIAARNGASRAKAWLTPRKCKRDLPDGGEGFRVFQTTALTCHHSEMPTQEFADVQRDIENVLALLKVTTDPNGRKALLREMRHLLGDAERLVQSTN